MVSGTWYDPNSSHAHAARLELVHGQLRVRLAERLESAPLAEVDIPRRLGDTARRLGFPAGGLFETRDNDGLDRLLASAGAGRRDWLLWLETNWLRGVALLLPALALLWWVSVYGVPGLAGVVAQHLPESTTRVLGERTVETLERLALEPTQLPPARQSVLRAQFQALVRSAQPGQHCELRFYAAAQFGANAFAIPPCFIVLTDDLVTLAENDAQIRAVLAHELGHVHHRHALRHLVQGALLSFLVVALTGDATQISATVAAAPALLLELSFSRDFEREADRYARELMRREGIALAAFPRILRLMTGTASDGGERAADGDGLGRYLTTHPEPAERARLFE